MAGGPQQAPDYHMFRWIPLAQRAYAIGVPFPRMVLTEFGWDRMEDLEGPGGVLEALDGFRGGKPDPGDGIISQRSPVQALVAAVE